jgi:hypothetical protein
MLPWQLSPRAAAVALLLGTVTAGIGAVNAQTLPPRFTMKAKAMLTPTPPFAVDDSLEVRAQLTPADAKPSTLTDEDGHLQITGTLSKATNVCYGDTIFEDDFDADGF